MKPNTYCPQCGAPQLPKDKQPVVGSQSFVIKYVCGSQVMYVIDGRYWDWKKECVTEVVDDGK